jgi:hypothetical protein
MKSPLAALLILALSGTAYADDPPSHVTPFLSGDEGSVHAVTGAFGPAKDTTVVVAWDLRGAGSYAGFALVPDAKAKQGYRKLALPKLPAGSIDGAMKTALVANLDKDADDELVIELGIQRSVASREGGYSYGTVTYVVLDWTGKAFVRAAALERKVAAAMKARPELQTDPLAEADLRKALGLAKM